MNKLKHFLKKSVIFLFAGSIFSLGFPNKHLPNHLIFSLIGAFLFFYFYDLNQRASKKKLIISYFLFSLGFAVTGFSWIAFTATEFGGVPFPFNTLLVLAFGVIAIPHLLYFLILHHLSFSLPIFKRIHTQHLFVRQAIFTLILVVFEYYTPELFPAHLGHTMIRYKEWLGMGQVFGNIGYSFIAYQFIFSFIHIIRFKIVDRISLATIFIFLILSFTIYKPYKKNLDDSLRIRLVQANIANNWKIDAEHGNENTYKIIFDRFMNLSKVTEPVDLIIWPETAIAETFHTSNFYKTATPFTNRSFGLLNQTGQKLISGGYEYATDSHSWERVHNTIFYLNEKSELLDTYQKRVLLPFGETLPFGENVNNFLSKFITNISYFASGKKTTLFEIKNYRFSAAICYEILFPEFFRDYFSTLKEYPHFVLNLSNDGWYGDSSEPRQHQLLSHWRSIEFNIPVVRATNTGVTSILYPDGTHGTEILTGETKAIDETLFLNKNVSPTIFYQFGFSTTLALGLFVILIQFLFFRSGPLSRDREV